MPSPTRNKLIFGNWKMNASPAQAQAQAQAIHAYIRNRIRTANADIAASLRILYGGSVKTNNAAELFTMPDIDGGLVGGASLDANEFAAIIHAAQG